MSKNIPQIFNKEWNLMEIIWDNPDGDGITMRKLVKLGAETCDWKRTTVYTMVSRLRERGIVTWNTETSRLVFANYTKEEMRQDILQKFIDKFYDGDKKACMEDLQKKN